jgi:predicted enzyme related to lactoylglutathione lyase
MMMSRRFCVRRVLPQWGLGTVCAVAAIAVGTAVAADAPKANAIRFELPPLVQPASREHHPGKVIWADLVTPDLAGAKRFYGGLFGWTFNDIHTGDTNYSIALLNGEPVGVLLQRPVQAGQHRQPAWLTFISVRDVGAAQRITVAEGGKVLSKPRSYPQRGRQAVFSDPQGAVFAVLQSSSGDPPDELADPGEWIWSSLVTRDPGTGAAFYQAVFGYEAFDLPDDDGLEHVLLSTHDYARASANALPAEATRLHPHWLNFVRVLSTTDAVAKVQSLGGRVLVEPHPDRHGGLVAVVADPSGAPFGLLEWTAEDSKEGAK